MTETPTRPQARGYWHDSWDFVCGDGDQGLFTAMYTDTARCLAPHAPIGHLPNHRAPSEPGPQVSPLSTLCAPHRTSVARLAGGGCSVGVASLGRLHHACVLRALPVSWLYCSCCFCYSSCVCWGYSYVHNLCVAACMYHHDLMYICTQLHLSPHIIQYI